MKSPHHFLAFSSKDFVSSLVKFFHPKMAFKVKSLNLFGGIAINSREEILNFDT